MSKVDQPNETIMITNEVLVLNELHPGLLDVEDVESTKYRQAEAYAARGKWYRIYLSVYKEYVHRGYLPDIEFIVGLRVEQYMK